MFVEFMSKINQPHQEWLNVLRLNYIFILTPRSSMVQQFCIELFPQYLLFIFNSLFQSYFAKEMGLICNDVFVHTTICATSLDHNMLSSSKQAIYLYNTINFWNRYSTITVQLSPDRCVYCYWEEQHFFSKEVV